MPDPADFEALRTAVHEVCREANKDIFNHLEGVLLRLVDRLEDLERRSLKFGLTETQESHNVGAGYVLRDNRWEWVQPPSTEPCGRCGGSHFTRDHVTVMDATERRERDGGQ